MYNEFTVIFHEKGPKTKQPGTMKIVSAKFSRHDERLIEVEFNGSNEKGAIPVIEIANLNAIRERFNF